MFLLFLCYCFTLSACVEIDQLQSLYHIENDVLTTVDGKKYPKIPYEGPLHEKLSLLLKDIDQAHIIYKAYSEYIVPLLSEQDGFEKALSKVCFFFGSPHSSPEKPLLAALKEENLGSWADLHAEALKQFIEKGNISSSPHLLKKNDRYTIVIITTSASGGNHSVAKAMAHFLASYENIQCFIVDSEEIAKETDLLFIATQDTTRDNFYCRYFQQMDLGLEALAARELMFKQLNQYIPYRFGAQLKQKVAELNPDFIISTRTYVSEDIPLCALGVPFRMIHCDYELTLELMDLYGKVDPNVMKFWIPSEDPRFFLPLFEKKNRLDLYNENDSYTTVIEKVALLTEQPLTLIQRQFELIGFPVGASFKSINELSSLREKWGVEPGEIPVLVSMGKNGRSLLESIFTECLDFEHTLPIRYIFVCGRNEELKKSLEAQSNRKNFTILGLLNLEEMNEWMNLCSVYVTKPGGSTSSEALETNTYLLMTETHPWESANQEKILKEKMGQILQSDGSIPAQIEDCIKNLTPNNYHPIPWQSLLIHYLNIQPKEKNATPMPSESPFYSQHILSCSSIPLL